MVTLQFLNLQTQFMKFGSVTFLIPMVFDNYFLLIGKVFACPSFTFLIILLL